MVPSRRLQALQASSRAIMDRAGRPNRNTVYFRDGVGGLFSIVSMPQVNILLSRLLYFLHATSPADAIYDNGTWSVTKFVHLSKLSPVRKFHPLPKENPRRLYNQFRLGRAVSLISASGC